MMAAYLEEVGVEGTVKFLGVIHQAVKLGFGYASVFQVEALEEVEGEPF
jgi:hypothetical protein